MSHSGTYDVAVVGAGPAGLTAALVLARRGISTVVLEEGSDLSLVSRASTIHPSTLELFAELGVIEDVMDAGALVDRVQYWDRKEGLLAEFSFELLQGYTQFPVRMQLDQSEVTRILRGHLESFGDLVRIQYNFHVDSVSSADDGYVVESYGQDGPAGGVSARFVVGADGAHSAVRHSLGVQFPGSMYNYRQVMILTTYPVAEAFPEYAPIIYMADEEHPLGLLTLPDHYRIVFHLEPEEDPAQVLEPSNIQKRLGTFLPPEKDQYPVRDALVFSTHRRVADRLRVDGVFLVGDAAHLNNPSGGMGMNSGIHDAYLLGKTLAAFLEGQCGDAALSSYAEVRRYTAIAYVQERSSRNVTFSRARGRSARDEQNEYMRALGADQQRGREFLLRSSMFDSAPRVLW